MNKKKLTALLFALTFTLSAATACGSSSSKSSKADTSGTDESAAESADSKLDVYLSEDGTPYYIDSDGNKMILYSYAAEDSEEESDPSEYYVYDTYSDGELSFDIPDGWFADTSGGYAMLLQEVEDGEDLNYNETMAVIPVSSVFESGTVDKSTIKDYFDQLVDYGYYTGYEITDSGKTTMSGETAKYYDVLSTYSLGTDDSDEDAEENTASFRTRYVVGKGDNAYCVIMTSNDDDDSFAIVVNAYEAFADSITVTVSSDDEDSADEDSADESASDEDTSESAADSE